MTDYKALCAELLAGADEYTGMNPYMRLDNAMKAARTALAAEQVSPDAGKVADPVIPCEYAGYLAAAYRNGFHAGHKHALTCAALAPQPEPLPSNYIDSEHTGQDLELLEIFYAACQAEGGTADEIHLRGIRAVLAATEPEPPAAGASHDY